MNISRGDIVEVDLGGPSDDDSRGAEMYKQRPAVVIQNDTGNQYSATTIIAPISGGRSSYPFQVNLPASTPGLSKHSYVMLDQIRTVDIQKRIAQQLGQIRDSQKMTEIDDAIRVSLGL
ncbi:type II toxin-antitoxin system PemK/MazF family toxin [Haloglomus litoreum]|uniref:type II toxin-antitoxin system PemK/MazF family toxin n=1 Tax=Haloglomus litoreum TaxID=3034026 RepID=UPI0023E8F8A4|nr:type II toxin-antitoxin system PemK/MazF family toxin [Haloglomus sp. DT116]